MPQWNRVGAFLSVFGLVVLFCGLFATQVCSAQTADQVENQTPLENQTSSQQMTPSADQLMNQSVDQQTGQQTDQQTGQQTDQQTGQLTNQQTISAEQIIEILRQEPDLLASVKIQVAQQSGVDPSTISDENIYDRIRQDASVRVLAAKELAEQGYSTNLTPEDQKAQNPTEIAPRKGTVPQAVKPHGALDRPYEDPDDPQVQHRLSPYRNLPSLDQLYAQFPTTEKKLHRFGSDTFLLGTGNANQLPMDLPVGPDYVLGPGDNLVVNIWGGRSQRLSLTVDRQGQIALPEAGTVTIDGLTITQAQSTIQKALGTQFQNERVEISLGRLRTVRVYVVGDVQRPGAYDVSSLSTPLNALYAAGGPTSRGSLRVLRQYRGKQLVSEIDLYDFLLRGIRSSVDRLQPGDTILVPPVGPQVSVSGMVRRPAVYELKGEQKLNEVLDLAGGILVSASLKQIRVERIEAHQRRTMLSLQLPEGHDGVMQDLNAFGMQDGDNVHISQILPYNEQAIYLEGHVFRPGKYSYRDGMTIGDLLHSYQDVMPEPADHAELVRLQPPDFRPETISFSLPDVLIGNDSIKLEPFDLIRIFSRYEIDSPKVSIEGEVLRPGRYPMSEGMTVAGLVRMAGGFKRSAYQDDADLSSYVVKDGQKVLLSHSVIAVKKALEGDKSADTVLKSGDVVSIRQLAGWQDIGASVAINGEVEHAGSYGLEEGERLSSVLKRAGGFREDAYPAGAVLDRIQVRELGEKARQQMIQRLETTPLNFKPGLLSGQEQTDVQQASKEQRDQVLAALRSHPASGRLVIRISPDISKWENTFADIELRAGDTLFIPKRPSFVLVSGQVNNPTAITYSPRKDAGWYLHQAGGTTRSGDKGAIFVVRADGAVVAHEGSWLGGSVLKVQIKPGDSIIVPEKAIGSQVWKNIISAAQIMSSVAVTGAVAGIF
jgi:protein involved in polysaccharide export with SLBB domain